MHSSTVIRRLPLLLLALALAPARMAVARPDGAPARAVGSFTRPAAGLYLPADVRAAIDAAGEAELLIGLADGMADDAPLPALQAAAARVQAAVLAGYGPDELRVVGRYDNLPILHAWASAAGLERLAADPRVASVELVVKVYPLGPALSPAQRPALMAEARLTVGADKVFDKWGFDGTGVGVAVLDTGIDNDHKDFEGAIVAQQCFSEGSRSCAPRGLPKSDNAEDEYGHGTGVSGMILGRGVTKGLNENNKQVTALGIAPRASLVAVRVFRDNGGAYDPDIVSGLDWVLNKQKEHNIRAVNMSLGGGAEIGTNCDNSHATVKAAFGRLVARSVTVVVATGNGGNSDRVAFPACISNAMSVGATYDRTYDGPARLANGGMWCARQTAPDIFTIACFTDRGRSLDVLAPGLIITHPALGGGIDSGAGTSYATPIVAGIVALLAQAKSDLRAADIQRLLQDTGRDVTHPESGDILKLVDAFAAVSKVMPALPPTAVPTTAATATATATSRPTNTATATSLAGDTATPNPSFTPPATATARPSVTLTATSRPVDTATRPAPTSGTETGRIFLPFLER